jgi:hypothetical protein
MDGRSYGSSVSAIPRKSNSGISTEVKTGQEHGDRLRNHRIPDSLNPIDSVIAQPVPIFQF